MLQKIWHLEHLINESNGVWCGICTKYLAFGTYPTSTVGALSGVDFEKIYSGWIGLLYRGSSTHNCLSTTSKNFIDSL